MDSAPPLEFPLPHPNEIMDVAGAADSGEEEEQGKSDHACRGEAKPTPSTSSIPAALFASTSSIMSRVLRKGAAVGPSSLPVVDAVEEHHHDHHQYPPVPLLLPEGF